MGKKKRKPIFDLPEFEHVARAFRQGSGPTTYDIWDEIDATWKRFGKEPWEGGVTASELVKTSHHLRLMFDSVMNMPSQAAREFMASDGGPQAFADNMLSEYMCHSMFHRAGHHVFRLWPALCHSLMATEVRAPRSLLKLPFLSFYLHFPLEIGDQLPVENRDGTSWPADGAFVSQAFEGPKGRMAPAPKDAISIKIMSRPAIGNDSKDANFHYYYIPTHDDETITIKKIMEHNKWKNAKGSPNFGGDGLKLVLNALLYINSSSNDVKYAGETEFKVLSDKYALKPAKEKQKIDRRKRALMAASRAHQHTAGTTIRIPSMPSDGAQTPGTSWKLAHRVQVRGHWRNQPYGPDRADSRLIWIKPHWRGPEMGEIVARRTYEVVTPDGKAT